MHRCGSGLRLRPQQGPTARDLGHLLETARQHFLEHRPIVLFLSDSGCPISEVFALRWADMAFGSGRRVTQHCLRHTFASLHLARDRNLKRVWETGG